MWGSWSPRECQGPRGHWPRPIPDITSMLVMGARGATDRGPALFSEKAPLAAG